VAKDDGDGCHLLHNKIHPFHHEEVWSYTSCILCEGTQNATYFSGCFARVPCILIDVVLVPHQEKVALQALL